MGLSLSRAIHGDAPHQDVQKVLRLLAALNVRDGNFSSWRDYSRKSMDMHKAIHQTSGISTLPARLDMMGLFLVERALTVKSQFASIDNFMASKSSTWLARVRGGSGLNISEEILSADATPAMSSSSSSDPRFRS